MSGRSDLVAGKCEVGDGDGDVGVNDFSDGGEEIELHSPHLFVARIQGGIRTWVQWIEVDPLPSSLQHCQICRYNDLLR